VRTVVSAWTGLVAVGAVALVGLLVGASVLASSVVLDAAASRVRHDNPGSDMPDAVQDALDNREPGEGIGDVISDLARSHRPRTHG
jgi:hypothetical protein